MQVERNSGCFKILNRNPDFSGNQFCPCQIANPWDWFCVAFDRFSSPTTTAAGPVLTRRHNNTINCERRSVHHGERKRTARSAKASHDDASLVSSSPNIDQTEIKHTTGPPGPIRPDEDKLFLVRKVAFVQLCAPS